MKRYLLIFLLSGMDTGALKAEKVLDGFDEEPFEQPVILPEKTRLSPVAAYMGEPSAGGTGKSRPCRACCKWWRWPQTDGRA